MGGYREAREVRHARGEPALNTRDLAIVGAGAAGLTAAIAAARTTPNLDIALFDSRIKIGAKILISGGTRCNVTNRQVNPTDYHGGPRHFVKHVLEAFTPEQTRAFFESLGVELILEPTGKYFPVTHSGKTVLEALLAEVNRLGIHLETGSKISGVRKDNDEFVLAVSRGEGAAQEERARRVVIATGGLSYPETGSDGAGFVMARQLGHRIIETSPALTPLTTDDEDWKALTGISVEASLSFKAAGGKRTENRGAVLFTHFGFSGPAALDLSRHVARAGRAAFEVSANFLPEHREDAVRGDWEGFVKSEKNKSVKNFLSETYGLPVRFVETFLSKQKIDVRAPLGSLGAARRRQLVHALFHCPLSVTGVVGYKKAEVTAGGVDLAQVRVATMESRLVSGLYFAGEILDMDGRIGGFNFQWAWSTGTIAGRAAGSALS